MQSRWCQGFSFAPSEPAALQQYAGGPCGVLGPVQAFLLRRLLYGDMAADSTSAASNSRVGSGGGESGDGDASASAAAAGGGGGGGTASGGGASVNWRAPTDIESHLVETLVDMLEQCARDSESGAGGWPVVIATTSMASGSSTEELSGDAASVTRLHCATRFVSYAERASARAALHAALPQYRGPHGVLLFLYSAVATRGVDRLAADQGVEQDTLITLPFGHANQSLVNLMLTGAATPHVSTFPRSSLNPKH